ncbi:hypothetical protein COOONC_03295 [Cooperia oncophora]
MPRHSGSGVVKEKDKDKDGTKEKPHGKEKHREKTDRKTHADNERVGPSRKHSVRPTDELKLLQDSLTQFFTPSAGRRCRQPPRKFDESGVNSDDSVHHHNESGGEKVEPPAEKIARRKKSSTESSIMKPLTVDVGGKS